MVAYSDDKEACKGKPRCLVWGHISRDVGGYQANLVRPIIPLGLDWEGRVRGWVRNNGNRTVLRPQQISRGWA
jgi:hypothetical protein